MIHCFIRKRLLKWLFKGTFYFQFYSFFFHINSICNTNLAQQTQLRRCPHTTAFQSGERVDSIRNWFAIKFILINYKEMFVWSLRKVKTLRIAHLHGNSTGIKRPISLLSNNFYPVYILFSILIFITCFFSFFFSLFSLSACESATFCAFVYLIQNLNGRILKVFWAPIIYLWNQIFAPGHDLIALDAINEPISFLIPIFLLLLCSFILRL